VESEILYLKKLKRILQFRYIPIILIIFSLFYTFLFINTKKQSNYNINEKVIEGYIADYNVVNNVLNLELIGKEKVLCRYFFSDTEEINNFRENYHLGDMIKLNGEITVPSKNTIFNLFNYQGYLEKENIKFIFDIDSYCKIKDNNNFFYKIKNRIIERIEKNNNKEYMYAFILGNSKYISDDVMESYRTNGISHLFAVSGMHVTLITLLLIKILKNIKYKELIAVLFVIFYMFLTASVSIIRAGVLYILFFINKKANLKLDKMRIMSLVLFVSVIIDPYIITKIGFQYSFTICLYMMLFDKLINKRNNKIYKLFMVSFIAFIVSIPITINNFFELNFLSIILNIFFVPIISYIIFPLSLLSFLFPFLGYLLTFFIDIFETLSLNISDIDWFIFIIPKMKIIYFLLYYLFITYALYKLLQDDKRGIIALIILLILHSNINYLNLSDSITFIDVSQGDSTLIKLKHNKSNILIDTGGVVNFNNNNYSIVKEKTIPYLKSTGISKIDYLLLTHGDFDHMGEAVNLVENFKVEKVIFNCGEYNELEQDLIKVLDKKKISYYSCIKELNIDNNKLYFLNNKDYGNENDNSNVIYTELNNHKFLFMGDAGVEVENDLIEKYNLKDIDVLKVGHHGSKTSSSKNFIDEINPKHSIISVGKNNRYGHPNDSVLDNLENSKIYRTDIDGSVMFEIKKNKLEVETCTP